MNSDQQPDDQKYELINRQEFIQYWQKRDDPKTVWISVILFLVVYLGGFALLTYLITLWLGEPIGKIEPSDLEEWSEVIEVIILYVIMLAYLVFIPAILIVLTLGYPKKDYRKCPACKASIVDYNRLVIIATGKCGRCGNKILTDN